jgi:hypothetical protein
MLSRRQTVRAQLRRGELLGTVLDTYVDRGREAERKRVVGIVAQLNKGVCWPIGQGRWKLEEARR